jgi:hypothetical protein
LFVYVSLSLTTPLCTLLVRFDVYWFTRLFFFLCSSVFASGFLFLCCFFMSYICF